MSNFCGLVYYVSDKGIFIANHKYSSDSLNLYRTFLFKNLFDFSHSLGLKCFKGEN